MKYFLLEKLEITQFKRMRLKSRISVKSKKNENDY